MRLVDVQRALELAERLLADTATTQERQEAALLLQLCAHDVLDRQPKPTGRHAKNANRDLWMTMDAIVGGWTEAQLKQRWAFTGQRTAKITRAWDARCREMIAGSPGQNWPLLIDMQRKQLI